MQKNNIPTSPYFPHIDGLRAIAVLAVLLFHADIDKDLGVFQGGFIGVDIFFVISGFLITRMILGALNEQSFSFGEFYVRRARRLFPALFVTIATSFCIGVFLYPPDELERLGGAALNATLSLSNFYFWLESGYFDADAYTKPLLHTWSLGVEEQFYLFWPVLLVLLSRFLSSRTLKFSLVALFILSLIVSEVFISTAPVAAFYLTPFRVFEFSFGALIWVYGAQLAQAKSLSSIFSLTGLSLILFGIVTFDAITPFPGLTALIPVVGTGLLISYGGHGVVGSFLSLPMVRYIGRVSYSLYLVHWPVIVFYPRILPGKISDLEEILLVAISFVLAAAMHRFIEKPFRSPKPLNKLSEAGFGLACALSAAVIIAPAASSWAAEGWNWRYGQRAAVDLDELRRETLDIAFSETGTIAFNESPELEKILVIGDSHSIDTANALYLTLPREKYDVKFLQYDDDCLLADELRKEMLTTEKIKKCDRALEVLKTSPKTWYANTIIFSSLWRVETAENISAYKTTIERNSLSGDKRYIVLGVGEVYHHFFSEGLRMLRNGEPIVGINSEAFKSRNASNNEIDDILERQSSELGMEFYRKHSIMCSNRSCDFVLDDGRLALYDSSHWTLAGANLFGRKLAQTLFSKE